MPLAKPTCIIIGGGPAGLMAADVVSRAGVAVTLYDAMPSFGRKLLLAGRGGLNLTHSEELDRFVTRYVGGGWIVPAVRAFGPTQLRALAEELGEPAFVGTSGRVFPKSFKSSPLLRALLRRLAQAGVAFVPRHRLRAVAADGAITLEAADGGLETHHPSVTILALGGASWPKLGANGDWVPLLAGCGVAIAPLVASNCGVTLDWSTDFAVRFAGTPLKSVAVTMAGVRRTGEMMVSRYGLEGGLIYAMGPQLRQAFGVQSEAVIEVDLRPDIPLAELEKRLARARAGQSTSTFLRKAAGLAPVAVAVLREAGFRHLPIESAPLARLIKALPLRVTGTASIERAISSAGGIASSACNERLMLKALPGVFVAGEMLDWDAPTGGYLLQACFATGARAAQGALEWLAEPKS